MSFKEKVQKTVLEMADGTNLKEIKEEFVKSTQAELMDRFDKVIMKGLEEWYENNGKKVIIQTIEENPEIIRKIVKEMKDETS